MPSEKQIEEMRRKHRQNMKDALTAAEQAEPARDAEREFNEVLKGAQEFNDILPERMRRNARDWLRPDDGKRMPEFEAANVYALLNRAGFTIMSKEDVEAVRDKALEEAAQALSNKSAEAQETAGRLAEKLSGELKGRKKTANWRSEKTHRERIAFYYRKASDLVLSLKSGGE